MSALNFRIDIDIETACEREEIQQEEAVVQTPRHYEFSPASQEGVDEAKSFHIRSQKVDTNFVIQCPMEIYLLLDGMWFSARCPSFESDSFFKRCSTFLKDVTEGGHLSISDSALFPRDEGRFVSMVQVEASWWYHRECLSYAIGTRNIWVVDERLGLVMQFDRTGERLVYASNQTKGRSETQGIGYSDLQGTR